MTIKIPETPLQLDLKYDSQTTGCTCVVKEITWERDESELHINVTLEKTYDMGNYHEKEWFPVISWELNYPKGRYACGDFSLEYEPVGKDLSFEIVETITMNGTLNLLFPNTVEIAKEYNDESCTV